MPRAGPACVESAASIARKGDDRVTIRPAVERRSRPSRSPDAPGAPQRLPGAGLRWDCGCETLAPPQTFYTRRGKRMLDVALGALLLAVLSPIMLAAAVAVILTSGWPAFYGARRLGRDGRPFTMWKLRTMRPDAEEMLERLLREDGAIALELKTRQKLRRDPRVTFIGKALRRTSLDELPQLWNVLRGDMSLVGPRPYLRRDLSEADEDILVVRPGMTGLWQVSGRNALPPRTRPELDRAYVREVSLAGDLRLLLLTFRPLIRLDGL